MAFVLLGLGALLLAGFDEASCRVVRCPMERPFGQETESGLQPTAWEELNPANYLMSELGSGP